MSAPWRKRAIGAMCSVILPDRTSNGIAFTVDALAELSDVYVKLKPGLEQATFAAEKFGARAGPEMQKLLEKGSEAIRAQGEAQADNMILTQANIDKAEELRIAEDNLTDSFAGFKYTIGNAVIPILVDAANAFQLLIAQEQLLRDALNKHNKDIVASEMSYAAYKKEVERTNEVAAEGMTIWQGLGVAFSFSEKAAAKFMPSIRLMSEYEYNAAQGAAEADRRLMMWGTTLRNTANTDIPNTNAAMDAMAARYTAQAGKFIADTQEMAASVRGDLSSAFADAKAAADGWVRGAGGDIAGMLQSADLEAGTLNQALIALDGQMGTNEYTAKLQKEAYKTMVDELERTGDVDAFNTSLARLKNGGFIPLQEQAILARVRIQELYAELAKLDGQTATAYVNVVSGSGGKTMNATPTYTPGVSPYYIPPAKKIGAANGLELDVPNRYPNDSFGPIYAQSGEHVSITKPGQSNGMTIENLYLTIGSVSNARQLLAELGAMANNARNAGRSYQGG